MRTGHGLCRQAGFTMIELIIVAVLVGIIAAVAIPRSTDVTQTAQNGVLNGVGGAVASASVINYSRRAGSTGGVAVADCAAALELATVPPGVTATGTLNTDGTPADCTLSSTSPPGSVTVAVYGAP